MEKKMGNAILLRMIIFLDSDKDPFLHPLLTRREYLALTLIDPTTHSRGSALHRT